MEINLKGRSFLKLLDYSPEELGYLLQLSTKLKSLKKNGELFQPLKGKNIALIFEKDSTRTRCAFEVAGYDLGMGVTYLGPTGTQMGKKESIKDTARVLGRMYEGIEFRGYSQDTVETLAKYSGVPIWNGLTDFSHPTQVLADLLTIMEHKGKLTGVKLAYLGDARYNMGNSLLIGCAKMGMDFRAVAPKALWPSIDLIEKAREIAKSTGAKITITEDVSSGTKGVDVIYTDVWVSMGESDSVWEERIKMLTPYQVNQVMMKNAGSKAIFLHCLPSFHNLETSIGKEVNMKHGLDGIEVTEEVFEGPQSVVFDQAENRLHTIKAVILATLGADK
ncbi:MAG TPA: ornithine carbamoyltransferase [Acholeplasmatales bacterium]|nr:ornithine carbamoyltransferase [Acholeplasmatales bacterium]